MNAMPSKNVTHYCPLNFTKTYRSSVFNDDKLSPNARALVDPLWRGEEKMKLDVINRINTLLYDRREVLEFGLERSMKLLVDYRVYEVVGVRCALAGRCNPGLRVLNVVLSRNGGRSERDAMYVCSFSDCVKLMECVARKMYPRDDGLNSSFL